MGGCLNVCVRGVQGHDHWLQVPKAGKVDMLMKMFCNRMKIDWAKCQTQATFKHGDTVLSPHTQVMQSGLGDDSVVEMGLTAPASP